MGTRGDSSKTAQDDSPTGHARTVKHEGLTKSLSIHGWIGAPLHMA